MKKVWITVISCAGAAAVAAGEGGFVRSIWLHPDCDQPSCREQIEQQLTDMGF